MSDTGRAVEVGARDGLQKLEGRAGVATGVDMPKLVAATNDVSRLIGRSPVSRVASALNAKRRMASSE